MSNLAPSTTDAAGSVSMPVPRVELPTTTIFANEQSAPTITITAADGTNRLSIPASAYFLRGFRDWALSETYPERGQISFSPQGLIIELSPELLETHNYIKSDVALVVHGLIVRHDLGRFIADRALFTSETANISTEPDSMFISRQAMRTGRCMLIESSRPGVSIEVTGSPDWILEVVSPSSVRKDKTMLRDGYFQAGVGEYWLIDALGDDVVFEILVPGQNEYVAVAAQNGWLASPTFGCSFRLTRKKDGDGFWLYTLHVHEER